MGTHKAMSGLTDEAVNPDLARAGELGAVPSWLAV